MNKHELQLNIDSLKPWYQKINLQGIKTSFKGSKYGGMEEATSLWKKVDSLIPEFKSKKILDLGSNAGYYSIMSAKKGASVVGIEMTPVFYKQSLFLKKYYENLWNAKLNLKFVHTNLSDVDFSTIGKFDYIFAFAVLHHIGKIEFNGKETSGALKEQKRVISEITEIADNIIVRCRNEKYTSAEYYNKIFKKLKFKPIKIIPEGKRSFIHYQKN